MLRHNSKAKTSLRGKRKLEAKIYDENFLRMFTASKPPLFPSRTNFNLTASSTCQDLDSLGPLEEGTHHETERERNTARVHQRYKEQYIHHKTTTEEE